MRYAEQSLNYLHSYVTGIRCDVYGDRSCALNCESCKSTSGKACTDRHVDTALLLALTRLRDHHDIDAKAN